MSRTLHVIDEQCGASSSVVLRLSIDAVSQASSQSHDEHAWLLFGGETLREEALALGLLGDRFRLCPLPTGLHTLLPRALARPRELMASSHRVVCWTERAAKIASQLSCAHVTRRVADATLCSTAKRIIDRAQRNRSEAAAIDRSTWRERWGVAEETTVVALLDDGEGRVDASTAAMVIALTHEALVETDPQRSDVRLLCHPLANQRAEASAFLAMLDADRLLIQDDAAASPWSVLHACDLALASSIVGAGLSLLWADAMGVATIVPYARDKTTLDELGNAIFARSSKPRDLADALTKVVMHGEALPRAIAQ
jgi:hypothetical protein